MSKIIHLAFCFLCVFALVPPVLSKEEAKPTLNKTWPLNHFMINNEPIMLKNVSGSYAVSFPISDRVEPESAELTLLLNNSNLLHERRGQLVVLLNGYVVGQIKLDPANTETQAKFTIAKEYLKSGYNQLTFKVAQHYTDSQCEDWSSPELWTRIDSVKSTLALNYALKPVEESLARLNSLINDRLDEYAISVLRSDEELSDDYLYWGAMLAQAVKLRLKYVPLTLNEQIVKPYQWPELEGKKAGRFNIDPVQLKNDAILIGSKDQINKLIPDEIIQAIKGPYLGIFRQDNNPHRFVLIVSGTDNQQVKMAAQAFALLNVPLPDDAQTVVKDINFNFIDAAALNHQAIVPGSTYQFSQLGFVNKSFDANDTDAKLEFRLPADMYSTEEAIVSVNLDLAYGAAMRKDSVINININSLFNHAVQLKEQSGAHYGNYRIDIPLRSFQTGLNYLTFKAVLTPSETGICAFVQTGNLIASIYQDSTITFPETGHVANLPDLKLFERTGFPLIKNGSAEQTVFKLLDRSSDSVVSSWYFIAKLASFTDAPVFDIHITLDDTLEQQNRVLIGKPTKETLGIFDAAPVRLGRLNQFPYRYKEKQQAPEEPLWEWMYRVLLSENAKPLVTKVEPENVSMTHTTGLGRNFLFMSYPSPNADDGVVFALLSEPEHSLSDGLTELLSPELWNQMQGNVFIWDKQGNFDWLKEGNTFVTGESSPRLAMSMHFSKHPWQWLALVLAMLILAARLIHQLLSKYKKTVHRQVQEDEDTN